MRARGWHGGRALRRIPLLALAALAVAACGDDGDPTGPGTGVGEIEGPAAVDASYRWIFEGWDAGQPRGIPAVELAWDVPEGTDREVFRVYGRRSGQGDYSLIASVTSCTPDVCRYTDVNVVPGGTYEYFVTAYDQTRGRESDGSSLDRVAVPSASAPAAPDSLRGVALDDAVFLQWVTSGAERYWVVLETEEGRVFDIGETDGSGYLDTRAENGNRYRYRVASVDTLGHVGALGPAVSAIPRPDYQAELIYAFADSAARSGFRFVSSDDLDPITEGDAAEAQLRLELVEGVLSLVPLGGTTITSGVLTTALTCGPGSDPQCFSIDDARDAEAPDDYSSSPTPVAAELTYLVRVRDGEGRTRYGKIRVSLEGADQEGRDLVVFDWAYQLVPDEPSLNRR